MKELTRRLSFAEQNEKDLTSYRLNVLTTYDNPSPQPSPARGEGVDISFAKQTVKDFSPFTPHSSLKFGFTLAEVLITLGIIGVVAALTLNILNANVQKTVLKNQFKKSYSTILNAYNKAYDEFGPHNCYYDGESTDCKAMYDLVKSNLKVVKSCAKAYDDGCTPLYKGVDEVARDNGGTDDDVNTMNRNLGWWNMTYLKTRQAYVLADGTIIISYFENSLRPFLIDTNGKKGPNKWGYDLFNFNLTKDRNKLEPSSTIIEKGGTSAKTILMNENW